MPVVRLQDNEQVLAEAAPSALWSWPGYVLTFGLYHFWRSRHRWVVTNQRLISQRGVMTRHERALPLERIQDVSTVVSPLVGGIVAVSTAGGALGVARIGPLTKAGAYEFSDVLIDAQRRRIESLVDAGDRSAGL